MTPKNLPVQEVSVQKEIIGDSPKDLRRKRLTIIGISILVVLLIAGLVIAVIYLLNNAEAASVVRDVFIIFMAFEFLIIGLVLILLFFQLAKLTNLLQNEIKPILESTNDTVSTVRGTTRFLSDNLTEPIIKMNEYMAGARQVFRTFKPKGKKKT